jgi:hypothetical protein
MIGLSVMASRHEGVCPGIQGCSDWPVYDSNVLPVMTVGVFLFI